MGYVYVPYPRWVTPPDGSPRKIVQSAAEETAITGVLMGEDGKPVDLKGNLKPPTIDEVLAAGYPLEAAAKIVEREQHMYEAGESPYGPGSQAGTAPIPPKPAIVTPPPPDAAPAVSEPTILVTASEPVQLGQTEAAAPVEAGQVEVPAEAAKPADAW